MVVIRNLAVSGHLTMHSFCRYMDCGNSFHVSVTEPYEHECPMASALRCSVQNKQVLGGGYTWCTYTCTCQNTCSYMNFRFAHPIYGFVCEINNSTAVSKAEDTEEGNRQDIIPQHVNVDLQLGEEDDEGEHEGGRGGGGGGGWWW